MLEQSHPSAALQQRSQVDHLVFVWENLGPMHADRLDALSRAVGDAPGVVALEFFERSEVYPWASVREGACRVQTLAGAGRRPARLVLACRLIRAALRVPNADYYICHYERPEVFLTALVLRLRGRRVFALFNSKFDDYPRSLLREVGKAILFAPFHGALCGSPRSRDYLAFLGVPRDNVVLGYNTVSVDRIERLSCALPAPGGVPFEARYFLVVARLVPKKNLAMVIDAYAKWLADAHHARDLHLCGSGPLEGGLRAQVAALGLSEHVHFHGFVQTDEVSRMLAGALCLILPSLEEQFGNVVIEAQALGVPALVSRAAGAADVLIDSGLNGFVIDPNSSDGCAALMKMLAEDSVRWASFAKASYETRYRGDVIQFVAGVRRLSELAAEDLLLK